LRIQSLVTFLVAGGEPLRSERGEPFGGTSMVALEGSDEPLAAEPRGERCVSAAAA
jgi:hypothetical protein